MVLAALTGLPKDIGELRFSLVSKAKFSLTPTGPGFFSLQLLPTLDMFPSVVQVYRSHLSFPRRQLREMVVFSTSFSPRKDLDLLVWHFVRVIHSL